MPFILLAVVIFGLVSYLLSNIYSANCNRVVSKYRKKKFPTYFMDGPKRRKKTYVAWKLTDLLHTSQFRKDKKNSGKIPHFKFSLFHTSHSFLLCLA